RQQEIVSQLKALSGFTWFELADFLGVNKSMIFKYRKGVHRIPLFRFTKLCEMAQVPQNNFGEFKVVEIDNKPKKAKMPKMSADLAEFLGFFAGDGCLTIRNTVAITCDAKSDRRYVLEKVIPIFKELFGLEPKTRIVRVTAIQCRVYSKQILEFISNEFGFPIGAKKNKIRIPKAILENRALSKCFIRGVFDTDGGFHRHNPFSSKIEITSYSDNFREDIYQTLKMLGFNPIMIGMRVYIMSKKEIDTFFRAIKPNNFKHLYKYAKFKETGQVPRHREIDYDSQEFKNFVQPIPNTRL
ncbi:MAG: LAGLIDADG family homing endonuclease, partial [Candidatus ainarchaeum sp.]|nr:LAGLIDADG family homing endonuclease [Candidatus ainarchaeum sp.]